MRECDFFVILCIIGRQMLAAQAEPKVQAAICSEGKVNPIRFPGGSVSLRHQGLKRRSFEGTFRTEIGSVIVWFGRRGTAHNRCQDSGPDALLLAESLALPCGVVMALGVEVNRADDAPLERSGCT